MFRKPRQIEQSVVDLFLAHYERMFEWASHVTGHDPQQAEDLVHDVFVHFALNRPDLNGVENLEGYLFITLRNFYQSQRRRMARSPAGPSSSIEYDSAEAGLRMMDARDRAAALRELQMVCRYACARKESSKAGSALTLRFFHGYYPGEIARLSLSTREAVAVLLRAARAEAAIYLTDPTRLGFIKERPSVETAANPELSLDATTDEIIAELRKAIYFTRQGRCLEPEHWRDIYDAGSAELLDCRTLAHLVSCPGCLDEVNRLLGLSPLSDRHPPDMLGPESSSKDRANTRRASLLTKSGAAQKSLRKYRRRLADVYEHTPRELRVVVNGLVLSAQKVANEVNELTLGVELAEPIRFVEIFSEQGVRLLFLNVTAPPAGAFEQAARVELSGGRTLETTLSFCGSWPNLRLRYRDPVFGNGFVVPEFVAPASAGSQDQQAIPAEAGTTNIPKQQAIPAEAGATNIRARLGEFRRRWLTREFLTRPGVVTSLIAIPLLSALIVATYSPRAISAAELINQARAAEEKLTAAPGQSVHRALELEERGPSDGRLLARRRVEIWRGAAEGRRFRQARRVYDEQKRLLAGEFTDSTGRTAVWRKGGAPQPADAAAPAAPRSLDDLWRLDLSAQEFASFIQPERAVVAEQGTVYLISFQAQPSEAGNQSAGLVKASLSLRKTDLRPIEERWWIRSEDAREREFRITDAGFERMPTSNVPATAFEVDRELIDASAGHRSANEDVPATPVSPSAASASPAATSLELEVEIASLLHRVGADLNEQIAVTRGPQGRLLVKGLVETAERKAVLHAALAPVARQPAVEIEILTVAEALALDRRINSKRSLLPERQAEITASITNSAMPVEAELRRRLAARGFSGQRLEEEIGRLAGSTLQSSRRAAQRAVALKNLITRFSAAEARSLSAGARAEWRAMLARHADALRREIGDLSDSLKPIFSHAAGAANADSVHIADDESMRRAVERLVTLCAQSDGVISAAFTISTDTAPAAALSAPRFWSDLKTIEQLSSEIHKFSTRQE